MVAICDNRMMICLQLIYCNFKKNEMEPTIEQLMAHGNSAWRLRMETALTINNAFV